ncbi:Probable squalene synthase Short=SQS; Short=SS; AltName: Full=FPP:FPP farnesyltransferase; AltName: Full=Farnesyl-diphosphate farnesyltransferase [Serendipita indica DSM 11827]|uniref:Squalene synthase n=1 Tax=Serendipita indica (strain DSM 11827) TaxID=1109443 RepID=G4TMV9_SERID|nr:Probable squalene synthase Short=SQS; Short=SS; AltName: Full=FPP:FPP farnesyltransferase; AltName: Full=Farnesyl-diphosphate farnesyltransferase [Serendipita indica DSM 11827]CCA72652.1 related to farnesyl-diphosphate farnesyltransferase [Serendipita indica DSM 11827]
MGKLQSLQLLFTHPTEFIVLAQYWLFHEPSRDITNPKEFKTSGYDRDSMKKCWEFLDKTSRSFSAVIKELDGDLARVICLFYLVLRGLDTIEDDMTLSDEIKQPILRTFHSKLSVEGWTFDGCGPFEKDRQLLVEFDNVITEMGHLDPLCREVITDITLKMETGMADFAHRAATSKTVPYLTTIAEYDLYCHYVAGLVGEGLSRLFAATGKEREWIADQLVLSNSMGLLLQKTNILRDFREDADERRYFWPQEIWGAYGFKRPEEMYAPEAGDKALWALSHMTLNALSHCVDALDYLVLLRNQTVFNFCAIPAVMAIATLELCFMNPAVFQRNVKIRKGEAVRLIMTSTNPMAVSYAFRDYARKIHRKAVVADPNYLALCVMCGKIETWVEHHYPTFVSFTKESKTIEYNAADPRSQIVKRYQELEREKVRRERGEEAVRAIPDPHVDNVVPWQLYAFVIGATIALFAVTGMIILFALWWFYGEEWNWVDIGSLAPRVDL